MTATPDSTTLKRCSRGEKCVHPDGCLQPATLDYFYKNSELSSGLHSCCKACASADRKNKTPEQRATIRKLARTRARKRQDKQREYRKTHKLPRASIESHRKYMVDYNRAPDFREKERLRDAERRRRPEYKQRKHINGLRRRAIERNLPNSFTTKDWSRALEYFQGRCAVCGLAPNDKRVIAGDHWIPVSSPDCPGTVVTNIVPLCHGLGGCNNRKLYLEAEVFLDRNFGEEAPQILARIYAYFSWVREQDND